MSELTTARKLPEDAGFRDLSDYARPLAVRIAERLRDTAVRAPHVTLAFGVVGLLGSACYAIGGYPAALAGAAALQAKNILDAVDGSLARLQNRRSRIGRFLDSIMDAIVAAALFGALGLTVSRDGGGSGPWVLAAAAFLAGLLQSSVFNYYYVRYRSRHGGDPTSRLVEGLTAEDRAMYGDRPFALLSLRGLLLLYTVIYRWQDALVRRLDRWAARPLVRAGRTAEAGRQRDSARFLTAVSLLGPGIQILALDLYTLAGFRALGTVLELFLWTVALGGTAYGLGLVLYLRAAAARRARSAGARRSG